MTMTSDDGFREPIAKSWRRASLAGLDPETALDDRTMADVDPRSHLLAAAGPVLEELTDRLRDTRLFTLLVDREGRIAHRWFGSREAQARFDDLGVDLGTSLSEEVIGTNGPGTALETRSSVTVHGGEHFAESLRDFSCFSQPILHPATKRLVGALDISSLAQEANPLFAPLVAMAVADIQRRLLEGSRVCERILLGAFQAGSRPSRPVVAIGGDLLLSNQAASDLLEGPDIALLRNLAGDLALRPRWTSSCGVANAPGSGPNESPAPGVACSCTSTLTSRAAERPVDDPARSPPRRPSVTSTSPGPPVPVAARRRSGRPRKGPAPCSPVVRRCWVDRPSGRRSSARPYGRRPAASVSTEWTCCRPS